MTDGARILAAEMVAATIAALPTMRESLIWFHIVSSAHGFYKTVFISFVIGMGALCAGILAYVINGR